MSPNQSNIIRMGRVLHKVELRGLAPPAEPRPAPPPPAPRAPLESGALQCDRGLGAEGNRCHYTQQVQAIAKLMETVKLQSRDLGRAVDNLATQLALRIAAKVIAREISQPEKIKALIANALAQVPLNERLTIKLNPADLEILEQARGVQLDGQLVLPADVILLPDPAIQRGGCIVEGAAGTLDARIETQLKLIEQALFSDQKLEK